MPQTGADLVGAGYPTSRPLSALLGGQNQVLQPNLPARSNLEFFGIGNLSDGTLGSTGVATAVAVPALPGDSFTKVTFFAGATPVLSPTHAWAAIYSGLTTPALIAQSSDTVVTSGSAAASPGSFTVQVPGAQITSVNAPFGYVYCSIMYAATQLPTAAVISTPTATSYQLSAPYAASPTTPLFWSATHGSTLTTTAPATITGQAAKAVTPIVVLQ